MNKTYEKYKKLKEYLGTEELLENLISALDTDILEENLDYIADMNDLMFEIDEDNLNFDDKNCDIEDRKLTRKQRVWYGEQLSKDINPRFLKRNYRFRIKAKGDKRK